MKNKVKAHVIDGMVCLGQNCHMWKLCDWYLCERFYSYSVPMFMVCLQAFGYPMTWKAKIWCFWRVHIKKQRNLGWLWLPRWLLWHLQRVLSLKWRYEWWSLLWWKHGRGHGPCWRAKYDSKC